jgi:hypothetical protein
MEGYCSTGQSPQRAVMPMEEEEVFKGLKINFANYREAQRDTKLS